MTVKTHVSETKQMRFFLISRFSRNNTPEVYLLIAEMKPTPEPAMSLPTTITGKVVLAVSKMQPTVNVKQPVMIVQRRPLDVLRVSID